MNSSLIWLRKVGLLEGLSFLLLLFIAMPLKYFANLPIYVTIVGAIHGVLFILFVLLVLVVWVRHRWPITRVILALLASVVPFGPFFLEARLRKEMDGA